MITMSYINGTIEEIEIGNLYYFGQLWDGCDGDADDLLESGAVSPDGESVAEFEIVERRPDPMEALVKVIDIF